MIELVQGGVSMIGAVVFLVMFLFITPQTRKAIMGSMGDSGGWIQTWAPFSYILLVVLFAAGLAALHLMTHWPKQPEPENPLARYKQDEFAD